MTKRDYIKIAAILGRHGKKMSVPDFTALAEDFASMLKADNSSFDKTRFMTACATERGF